MLGIDAGDDLDVLQGLLDQPSGLLLCAGMPRNGRSTTLHAMAASLLRPDRRVWSVEERVHLLQPDMRQSEFNSRQPGACEAALLALREADPDVVLVDELRDAAAARAALDLALSGRLVLAALPARSAHDAVSRLVEQGLPAHDLAEGLLGVHHQRLVKRLCSHCRMSRSAKDTEVEDWLGLVLHGQHRVLQAADARDQPDVLERPHQAHAGLLQVVVEDDVVHVPQRVEVAEPPVDGYSQDGMVGHA